jgi:DtxR family Mn-dependent transcriptional regulator
MENLKLSEDAEELLAALWVAQVEEGPSAPEHHAAAGPSNPAAVQKLVEAGLVEDRGGLLALTEEGRAQAASVIRRERLAERLLADVINVGDDAATEAACRFEHVLREGIDDRICTLLGHPRVCPHGRPIPPGDCCREGARAASMVVSPLLELVPGQSGAIAYIHSSRRDMLQRLLSMGATPGAPIRLLQKFPSVVFELGHGQVAVDRETARDIYVRVTRPRPSPPRRAGWLQRARPALGFRRRHRGTV